MTLLAADTRVLADRPPAPADRLLRGRERGWWGMVMMITTEAMIFGGLLSAYFFLRAQSKSWPLEGIKPPDLYHIAPFTVILLASSLPLFWMEHGLKRGELWRVRPALAVSWAMGAAFFVNQVFEYKALKFGVSTNAYGSLFYVITGLHGLHVVIGLLMSLVVQAKVWMRRITAERHLTVEVFSLYWHFVDAVWIFVFSSLYLSAHVR